MVPANFELRRLHGPCGNFDASATVDDGSCDVASCYGCTYLMRATSTQAPPLKMARVSTIFARDAPISRRPATSTRMPPSTMVLARRLTAQACAGARPSLTRAAFVQETTRHAKVCTYPDACNFDPNASLDNGSCEYDNCAGCTDDAACNYEANATIDDGSCDDSASDAWTRTPATTRLATIEDGSCDYDLV